MLDFMDKELISSFFNESGYVLNFSDSTFNQFTLNSVGIPIKSKYRLSKAKSLEAFIDEEADDNILKLLTDLVRYIENTNYKLNEDQIALLPKIEQIIAYNSNSHVLSMQLIESVGIQFNDGYISNQMEVMQSLLDTSTADVIGKAKELVESCFKHILDDMNQEYPTNSSIASLRKKVFTELNLDAKTNNAARNNEDVKKILNSFNSIIDGLSNLRNDKGDGHGKGKNFQPLPKRYAELAMNASLTVVQFTWNTYKDLKNRRNFNIY